MNIFKSFFAVFSAFGRLCPLYGSVKEYKIIYRVLKYCRNRKTQPSWRKDGGKFMAEKVKEVLKSVRSSVVKAMEHNKGKSNWTNIGVLLTNILAFEAYRSISRTLAEYQGKQAVYIFSKAAVAVMWILLAWEFVCLVEYENWRKAGIFLRDLAGKAAGYLRRYTWRQKLAAASILVLFAAAGTVIASMIPEKKYYASVTEIYGMPAGVGDELGPEERRSRSEYWQIKDYPYRNTMVLTHMDAYQQMELMKQYSSIYGMRLFAAPARIEYKYKTNKDKYRSYDESVYLNASKYKFRELVKTSYYSSSGKLLLELEENGQDRYEINAYSAQETPQLFQSTLLLLPSGQEAEKGMLSREIEVSYNSKGLPQMRWLSDGIYNQYGINGEYYTYDEQNRISELCYLDVNGNAVCNKLGIMLVAFQYYDNGNLRNICYYSDENGTQAVEGFYGAFCEKFVYDSQGNLKERKQLDRSKNWWHDINGVYRYEYTYQKGALVQESFFGIGDKPIREKRFHTNTVGFGKRTVNGGQEIVVCLDTAAVLPDGDSAVSAAAQKTESASYVQSSPPEGTVSGKDFVPAGQQNENADAGNRYENGMRTQSDGQEEKRLRNYTMIRHKIKKGRIEELSYYDSENNIVENEQGCASKRFGYDSGLRVAEESYWDAEGKRCLIHGGYAIVRNTYDEEDGSIRKIEYLDLEKAPAFNKELGYSFVRIEHGALDEGEKITRFYCDMEGNLTELPELGYAKSEQFYGENGLLAREVYYDKKEVPACRADYKVAEISYDYSDSGNLVREWYKDVQGNSANRSDTGYAVRYREYEDGQLVREHYDGCIDQKLTAVTDKKTGAAVIRYTYDKGQKLEERYFDVEEKPVLRRDTGCAAVRYEYNDNGKQAAQYYYGTDDKLILNLDTGYAFVKYEYNKSGQLTDVSYYGTDEQAVISKRYHCAGFEYKYDDMGNREDIWYKGLNGGHMVRSDLGYAHVHKEYDNFGNVLSASYKDAKGQPAAVKGAGYVSFKDVFEDGNWIEGRYYDENGRLTRNHEKGYAVIKMQYDGQGRRRAEYYYGVDEKPVICAEYSCAGFEYEYDQYGNRTDIWYVGTDGRRIQRRDLGCAHTHKEYDASGNVIKTSYEDIEGMPAAIKGGGYASCENLYEDGNWTESRYYDAEGKLTLNGEKGYAVIKLQYNEQGQRESEYYYGTDEMRIISTEYHCAGFRYKYDWYGDKTDIWYVGTDGGLMQRRDLGYAHVHKTYDTFGNLIREDFTDSNEQVAAAVQGGYAYYKDVYENGNWVETRYYDADNQPVMHSERGYAVIKLEYDQEGQRISERFYGTDGKPAVSAKYHCAGFDYKLDDLGNREDVWYVGIDDNYMIRDDLGYAHVHAVFDKLGNKTQEFYMDTGGKPIVCREGGVASYTNKYVDGNWVEGRYYDTKGQLAMRKDKGYAVVQLKYDEFNRQIFSCYLGTAEQPVINTEYCCAGREFIYDENDNLDIWFKGIDGKNMIRRDTGYAHVRKEYDMYGNIVSECYTDEEENPVLYKGRGYASCQYRYKNGNKEECRYYGRDGELTLRSDTGYAVTKIDYDIYGQKTGELYYGVDEQPIISTKYHCAGFRYKFDDRGNQEDLWYIGLDDRCMIRDDLGYAHEHTEYDAAGNQTAVYYTDTEGHSVVWKEGGYASREDSYEDGKRMECRYFDTDGKLVLRKDTGYAVIRFLYNDSRQCTAEYYYGTDSLPVIRRDQHCAARGYTIDANGITKEMWYLGLDGKLMVRDDLGYAGVRWEHDILGNNTEEAYMDAEGRPATAVNGGYASCKTVYENGRIIERSYYDVQNKLVLHDKEKYAVIKYKYDDFGQKLGEYYYGTDRQPVIDSRYCCAGCEYQYDERGNNTYVWYKGGNNERIEREDTGASLYFMCYDEWDHKIQVGYYDLNLIPVVQENSGYALFKDTYEGIRRTKREYLDGDNHTVINNDVGYAVRNWQYNSLGQLERQIDCDSEGQRINNKNGYAEIEYKYDLSGNCNSKLYFDASGAAITW